MNLSDLGERGLIARMRGAMPSRADVLVGAGDDCALVAWTDEEDLVLKSDPVREGHHFLPDTDPRLVGRKALARVLSDFASMGAEPQTEPVSRLPVRHWAARRAARHAEKRRAKSLSRRRPSGEA